MASRWASTTASAYSGNGLATTADSDDKLVEGEAVHGVNSVVGVNTPPDPLGDCFSVSPAPAYGEHPLDSSDEKDDSDALDTPCTSRITP